MVRWRMASSAARRWPSSVKRMERSSAKLIRPELFHAMDDFRCRRRRDVEPSSQPGLRDASRRSPAARRRLRGRTRSCWLLPRSPAPPLVERLQQTLHPVLDRARQRLVLRRRRARGNGPSDGRCRLGIRDPSDEARPARCRTRSAGRRRRCTASEGCAWRSTRHVSQSANSLRRSWFSSTQLA